MVMAVLQSPLASESCYGISNISQHESEAVWAEKSKLVENERHRRLREALRKQGPTEHFGVPSLGVEKGQSDIYFYKEVFRGWADVSDSATVTSVVIQVPNKYESLRELDLELQTDVLLVFLHGFPGRRDYDIGYGVKGTISLHRKAEMDRSTYTERLFESAGANDASWVAADVEIISVGVDEDSATRKVCSLKANLVFPLRDREKVPKILTNE